MPTCISRPAGYGSSGGTGGRVARSAAGGATDGAVGEMSLLVARRGSGGLLRMAPPLGVD